MKQDPSKPAVSASVVLQGSFKKIVDFVFEKRESFDKETLAVDNHLFFVNLKQQVHQLPLQAGRRWNWLKSKLLEYEYNEGESIDFHARVCFVIFTLAQNREDRETFEFLLDDTEQDQMYDVCLTVCEQLSDGTPEVRKMSDKCKLYLYDRVKKLSGNHSLLSLPDKMRRLEMDYQGLLVSYKRMSSRFCSVKSERENLKSENHELQQTKNTLWKNWDKLNHDFDKYKENHPETKPSQIKEAKKEIQNLKTQLQRAMIEKTRALNNMKASHVNAK